MIQTMFILAAIIAPPQQPNTIVVDWGKRSGYDYQTISDAILNGGLVKGDTILVRGLVRNGYPAG